MPWLRLVRLSAEAVTLPSQSQPVRQAVRSDLPQLAGVLGRSLIADPLFQWAWRGRASVEDLTELTQRLYAGRRPLT